MKFFIAIFALFFFFSFSNGHRPLYQVLEEEGNLLAYFPFDKSVNEYSKKVAVSTTSPPELLPQSGYTGGSARFNGVTSFLKVALDITRQRYLNLTLGAWVRAYDVGNHIRWIASNDDLTFDRSLGIDFRSGRWGWSALNGQRTEGGLEVKTNTWQFVTVVYAGDRGRLYVDNRFTEFKVSNSKGKNFFEIGRAPCCGQFWLGEIDNLFVYGEALSEGSVEEVRRRFIWERLLLQLRSRGELLAFFPFDRFGPTQLTDLYGKVKTKVAPNTFFQSVPGFNGEALQFNGSQSVTVELDISGGSHKDITIGCWAKISKYSMDHKKALVSIERNNYDRFLGLDHRSGKSGYTVYNGKTAVGGLPVKTNVWQFVAVSYDNNARSVTVLTDEESVTDKYHISFQKSKNFLIGQSPVGNNTNWEGEIDNLFVIGSALKTNDLLALRRAFIRVNQDTNGLN